MVILLDSIDPFHQDGRCVNQTASGACAPSVYQECSVLEDTASAQLQIFDD